MKTYSKQKLAQRALQVLNKHHVDAVFATSDGQIFLSQNRANLHAKELGGRVSVYPFTITDTFVPEETKIPTPTISNEDGDKEEKDPDDNEVDRIDARTLEDVEKMSVKELTILVNEQEDLVQLEAILVAERAGKNRKTAIEAITNRIESIQSEENDEETEASDSDEEKE